MLITLLVSLPQELFCFFDHHQLDENPSPFFLSSEQVSSPPKLFLVKCHILPKFVLVVKTLFISLQNEYIYPFIFLLPTSLLEVKGFFQSICFPRLFFPPTQNIPPYCSNTST